MKHMIPCETCGGKGKQELHPALSETLKAIPSRGSISAMDVAPKLNGVEMTAINNRLERLRKYGFLTRERHGKYWRYSRV